MPTFGAFTSANGTDASFAGPTVSGSDTLGIVIICHGGNSGPGTVESVTWDGNSMTRVTASASRRVHIFKITSPASGGTVVVADTPAISASTVNYAMYWSDAGDVVQTADGSSSGGSEATATLGSNTTSGNTMAAGGIYWGSGANTVTLTSWEVNGSATGITEAGETQINNGANDLVTEFAYDDDGATGSTDSMSVTPGSDTLNLNLTVFEISGPGGFPDAPANLTATAVSTSQINLSWDAVSGAGGYDIERDSVVIVSDQAGTTYNDTGLNTGQSYDYRVRAVS